jgi:predicted peptidase
MKTAIAAAAAALLLAHQPAAAQQLPKVLETEVRQSARLQYLLDLPESYASDDAKRWPLLLYLHGGSARGDDLERVRKMGLPARLEKEPNFPFIVASPLCPEGEIWTNVPELTALLDELVRRYRVDEQRVYVTGHSMGGRGALYLAYREPQRFAAVVALSPISPITAWAKQLHNVPLWLIHGAKDEQAPIRSSEELAQAIEKLGSQQLRFTPLAEADHFLLEWFAPDEIFDWLLQHRRSPNSKAD